MMNITDCLLNTKIGVIGLGYVGLPMARLFSTRFLTIGYDQSPERCQEITTGHDRNLEVTDEQLQEAISCGRLQITNQSNYLRNCNFYVVAVPTPVDENHKPNLHYLQEASKTVAHTMFPGSTIVFESTVYPGVIEDICVPIIEKESGLKLNHDFFVGYSPERINPGDKKHTIENTIKITSGSTPETSDYIDAVYNSVLKNGTYRAPSIKVAEAAKVIENCQRDLNIAFMNELAKIFSLLDIDTHDVLEAASTKWNFIPMNPGLVGGHCISVDPYYLAQCAENKGYTPEVILAGRRINNSMASFVANETIKLMLQKGIDVTKAEIILMGFTFKENCPDTRNTRIIDIYHSLKEYNVAKIVVYDRWVDPQQVFLQYGIKVITEPPKGEHFDAAIVAVAHREFREGTTDVLSFVKPKHVIYDVKGILPRNIVDGRL
ncbi:MAG: nucleotide sugar dehydrogenase [Bacteroidales bacterium]|nr:nucleotide sugar dehydrogenase [Bacteroidales bacterium]